MVRLLWSSFTVNLETRFTLEELYHILWLISPVRNKAVFEEYRRRGELCFDYDKALKVWSRHFVTDIVMCLVISVFDGGYHIAVIEVYSYEILAFVCCFLFLYVFFYNWKLYF